MNLEVDSEQSNTLLNPIGHKFPESFELKQGRYSNLPTAILWEMIKSNSLNNAPMQSLLCVINGILEASIEKKNGEIPQRVASLLKRVMQVLECRISSQAEHIRNQNKFFKSREEKYQSRIRVLESLANGTTEETKIVINQLQLIKTEKLKIEERKKDAEQDVIRLMKEKVYLENTISELKQDLKTTKEMRENQCQEMESKLKETEAHLNGKIKEFECLLEDSMNKIKELEEASESKLESWNKKEIFFQNFISSELLSVQDLRKTSMSIKQEVLQSQKKWKDELTSLGVKMKGLVDAADNYHMLLAENQRLFNEVQELKGNIRVYCRIRPFLSGQNEKSTTIGYIDEKGELLIINPSKQGKDGHRMFKFNRVFGPSASQAEVFSDVQPLVRSVLDGYNVCIFAYGQTGSGKTYTMSGPSLEAVEDWGVNYRALNDLFDASYSRRNAYSYEVGVQIVEIYNEQVRDLLSDDGLQKRLGIWSITQPNGLAVPEASMHRVMSTSDVLQLMQTGETNRAVGSTALNERSSRSHSVLTVHVRGVDLKSGSISKGCLHLIDLAGSERVDRSEVAGDRLKEAQHINKSLSALGDVIFALARKSTHVPYRNSKLTQVLQNSLGVQAKTLMFVQINPDIESYSETISTLKFAERVSGVELGAARSNKDSKEVKDLLEQVASLKGTIARKDEEFERLQLLKECGAQFHMLNKEGDANKLVIHSSSLGISSLCGTAEQGQALPKGRPLEYTVKALDPENCSESSSKSYEANCRDMDQSSQTDAELLVSCDADLEERTSNISYRSFSLGTETDASISSLIESKVPSRNNKSLILKTGQAVSSKPKLGDIIKFAGGKKTATSQATASLTKTPKNRK